MPLEHWHVVVDAMAVALETGSLSTFQKTRVLTATRRIHAALHTHDDYATLHPKEV
jgi:hypothetical protein